MGVDSLLTLCGDLLEMGSMAKGSQMCGWSGHVLTAREPPWEQNGLPPIVNMM